MTLAIIKPDAVGKRFTGKIIDHILSTGFDIAAMKKIHMTTEEAQGFYAVHKERPFFNDLVEFMTSGPCIIAALKKENAVEAWRATIGATNPEESDEGTIRKLYAESVQNNAVHGSDSGENAVKEIAFFFSADEILTD